METPEKELAECLLRAVRQVSIRKEVFVQYILVQEKDDTGIRKISDTTILDFNQNNSIPIMEKMTVVEIKNNKIGTEALIKFEDKSGFTIPSIAISTRINTQKNPEWVSKTPKGTKFYAAVGSIVQSSDFTDAFTRSDTNAIGALVPYLVKPHISGNSSMYETVMHGVYIARRWYNSDEKRFYSLAILPK